MGGTAKGGGRDSRAGSAAVPGMRRMNDAYPTPSQAASLRSLGKTQVPEHMMNATPLCKAHGGGRGWPRSSQCQSTHGVNWHCPLTPSPRPQPSADDMEPYFVAVLRVEMDLGLLPHT